MNLIKKTLKTWETETKSQKTLIKLLKEIKKNENENESITWIVEFKSESQDEKGETTSYTTQTREYKSRNAAMNKIRKMINNKEE